VKKSAKKWKKRKNRLEFRFALFRFEAKITKSKRSEKFRAKKTKKSRKKLKKAKKSEKIDLNFASLCFTSKQKLVKWSEAKNLSKNKRKEAKKETRNFIVK
jgi:hypothetical protein